MEFTIGFDCISVNVPFTKKNIAKSIEGRRWNPNGIYGKATWEFKKDSQSIKELDRLFDLGILSVSRETKMQNLEKAKQDRSKIETIFPKRDLDLTTTDKLDNKKRWVSTIDPFPHQIQGLNYMIDQKQCAIFWEMGLGKTKVCVDWIGYAYYKNLIRGVLIVCPKSVITSWIEEFDNHGVTNYVVLDGTKRQRLKLMDPEKINIINYEGLLVLKNEIGIFNYPDIAIILDESSRIKNPQSKRAKMLVKYYDHCVYKFLLSGTPITQNVVDIFSQYQFLNPDYLGFQSWYTFRNYYCEMGGYMNYEITGYKHLPELKQKINDHAYILKKTDSTLELPDKNYIKRSLEMPKDLTEQYRSMEKDLILEFEDRDDITATIILTKLLRLSEILSGQFVKESLNVKLKELLQVITDESGDQKVVVWCRFTKSIELVSNALNKLGIGHVTFQGTTEDRTGTINKFREDPDCKVFIGQIQTGGIGINLQCASLVIYFENNFSLQDRLQSEDRCHRSGQTRNVTYVDLVYTGTIDEDILKAIKDKKEIADYLIPSFRGTK